MPGDPVLVIGGTRGTGLHAAHFLRARGVPVRILARNPGAALQRLGSGFEIIEGDLTRANSLPAAVANTSHILFTAGVRSGRFSRRSITRATEFEGVRHTLAAALSNGFTGRFVYMTAIGVWRDSFFGSALNVWKGGTLHWRRLAEGAIRASGVDYTVVRAAFLLNRAPRTHEVVIRQFASPLSFTEAIARGDVAEALVEAMYHPAVSRASFEVAWTKGARRAEWRALLNDVIPDSERTDIPHAG